MKKKLQSYKKDKTPIEEIRKERVSFLLFTIVCVSAENAVTCNQRHFTNENTGKNGHRSHETGM